MKKKFYLICVLFLCILFAGCGDDEEEDYSIGEITITGIPATIPYNGSGTPNSTFKVYLNASNSQSEYDMPVAKGVAKVSDGTPTGSTYTVIIRLRNPNPGDNKNPNLDTGPWSGTANYFSVVISPNNVTGGVNTIWAKAGVTLDKGKKICDWNSLMDFRELPGFSSKTEALFNDIICKDPEITH